MTKSIFCVAKDDLLHEIANFISPQWIELGRKLSIPKRELDKITSKHKKVEERAFQMLRYWKRNSGRNATVKILLDALTAIGRQNVVEYLQGIAFRHLLPASF